MTKQVDFFKALGAMTFLALQSPLHRNWQLSDMETNFLPALMKNQCKIYFNDDGMPQAFITWALLDDDTHNRLMEDGLTPNHDKWDSGEKLWFIDLVAPHGDALMVVRDMQRNYFPSIHCHSIRRTINGSMRKYSNWRNVVFKHN